MSTSGPQFPPNTEREREVEEVVADTAAAEAAVESDLDDLERLEAERAEALDTARRVQADFENYRKRVQREQSTLVERATERLVEDLLPVLDSFDGALGSLVSATSPDAEKVRDGVVGIRTQFVSVLERAGLEPIDAVGTQFDPNQHEAVMQDDGDGEPHVAEVLRGGYRLKGRVLRPAMVRVTRRELTMAPQREWFEKDYYAELGVAKDASEKDVTRAYRKLAKQFHPDANSGDSAAEERFKEISAAHDVLGDSEKRKEYDEVREMVASGAGPRGPGGFGGGGFPGGGFPGGGASGFQNVRVEDLGDLGDLGGMFGNLFGGGGGGGGRPRRGRTQAPAGPQRGQDIETELHLDFLDAVHGITTSVNITSEAPCHVCNGTGAKPGTFPERCTTCNGAGSVAVDQGPFSFSEVCPTCGGRGSVVKDRCKHCKGRGIEVRPRTVKVRIPAGVDDGQRIRVKGRGTPGLNGAPPGDLYVVVHVAPHAVFVRSGTWDLAVKVPITFAEAALGAQVKVPTLDAPVTVKVPAGTQTGKTVRIRGRGIPRASGDPGALLVTFDVVVPQDLDDGAIAAIEQLAAALPDNPREHLGV